MPDAAVQTDQARKIVLVVGKDGSVTPRPVMLGPVVDGLRVVRSGLTTVGPVIISGTQLAMPGIKVQVRAGKIVPQALAAAPDTVRRPAERRSDLRRATELAAFLESRPRGGEKISCDCRASSSRGRSSPRSSRS